MKELILKKIKPLLNYVIVTADKYSAEELADMHGGIIRTDMVDQIKPYQKIVALSDRAFNEGFKEGDIVAININRYGRSTQKQDTLKDSIDEYYMSQIIYTVPHIIIDGVEYLKLGTNDIEFIIEEFEEVEVKPKINLEGFDNNIIVPNTKVLN